VLWDKDDIYRERNEKKKTWKEVCICLQEDFESLGDVKKTRLMSIAIIYLTRLIEVRTNLCLFFSFYVLYCSYF